MKRSGTARRASKPKSGRPCTACPLLFYGFGFLGVPSGFDEEKSRGQFPPFSMLPRWFKALFLSVRSLFVENFLGVPSGFDTEKERGIGPLFSLVRPLFRAFSRCSLSVRWRFLSVCSRFDAVSLEKQEPHKRPYLRKSGQIINGIHHGNNFLFVVFAFIRALHM